MYKTFLNMDFLLLLRKHYGAAGCLTCAFLAQLSQIPRESEPQNNKNAFSHSSHPTGWKSNVKVFQRLWVGFFWLLPLLVSLSIPWPGSTSPVSASMVPSPPPLYFHLIKMLTSAKTLLGYPGWTLFSRVLNNLSYADDTTLMAESEEELKNLVMKVKEESEKLA